MIYVKLCLCAYVCVAVCEYECRDPLETRKGWSSGAGGAGSRELPDMGTKHWPLEDQCLFLINGNVSPTCNTQQLLCSVIACFYLLLCMAAQWMRRHFSVPIADEKTESQGMSLAPRHSPDRESPVSGENCLGQHLCTKTATSMLLWYRQGHAVGDRNPSHLSVLTPCTLPVKMLEPIEPDLFYSWWPVTSET